MQLTPFGATNWNDAGPVPNVAKVIRRTRQRTHTLATLSASTQRPRAASPDTGTGIGTQRGRRPFYGWAIIAALFAILSVHSGLAFYNASVILSAATDELGASVSSISGATGLFFAISGLAGFVLARPMDRIDIRWFFLAGGVIGAAALFSLRWVDSVLDLYIFFAFFGIGFGVGGLLPAMTLVTRWFDRRRSVAISVASTGLSVGGIVLTPIAVYLIQRGGLADAGPLMAIIWIAGIVPIALLVLRPFPSSLGLRPDGEPPAAASDSNAPDASAEQQEPDDENPPGATFAQARRSRFFIGLCAAYLFIFFGQVGALAQLFNMVQERADATVAGTALSSLAAASVVARLIGGVVVIRVDTRLFATALALVQVAALVLLALAGSSITLIGFAIVFGMSIGNLLMLQPLLLAEAFGVAAYSRIYSSNQLIGTAGVAAGPFVLGVVRDLVDYRSAFLVAGLASLLGAISLLASGTTASVKKIWL